MSDIKAVQMFGGTPVTQDDANNDPNGPFDAIQATGVAGLAKVHTYNGDDLPIYMILGKIYYIKCTRVWTTGTAATNIIGMTQINQQVAMR